MHRNEKRSAGGVNVGASSILIIFILLCLVTFATLSVVSARADYTLSEKSAATTTAYYTACNYAEARLADIDNTLREVWEAELKKSNNLPAGTGVSAFSPSAYQTALLQAAYPEGVTVSKAAGGVQLACSFPAGENQRLEVTLVAGLPQEGGAFYTVTGWKLHSTADWQPDDHLNVWSRE